MISCKSFDKSTECFKASNLLYNDTQQTGYRDESHV